MVYSQAAELRRRLQEAEAVAAERGEVVAALEGRLEAPAGRGAMSRPSSQRSRHLAVLWVAE